MVKNMKKGQLGKTYWKYIRKSFKGDFTRIIAIISIVALGIGFLVGLLSTTPDLYKSMDTYYDSTNFADVTIRSTIGFSEGTDDFLKENISEINDIVMTSEKETYIDIGENRLLARISYRSFDENRNDKLELIEGRLPNNKNECLMLESKDSKIAYTVDSVFSLQEENITNTYTIVGVVKDPYYIAAQSEQSLITGAAIESILYFDEAYYDDLVYTNASITFTKTKEMDSFGKEYENYVERKMAEISAISDDALNLRIEEINFVIREKALEESKNLIREYLSFLPEEAIEEIIKDIENQQWFQDIVDANAEEAFDELVSSMAPAWYVLNRDMVKSAYTFKSDASKVQTISTIFPPFFFLIALLVTLSSISRIITKDRQFIGTFKALGFNKKQISLKYILYGLVSSIIGCAIGVGIGLFALPAVLMYTYQSLYYIPMMSFVFVPGYVITFSALMVLLVLAIVISVSLINLKEPAASLMLGGKAPKPGKKILLEKIPFVWNKMKFKYKSMFRNIFRFKKNLMMMIIGIGGCSALLLTGFGIQDSFSAITNEQYSLIIKYDAIVSVNPGINADEVFNTSTESYTNIMYQHGTVKKNETINVEIIGANQDILKFVGFYDSKLNEIDFNDDSVIISKQIADELDVGENNVIQLDTDYGTKNIIITDVCQNYVSNYVYFGSKSYKRYFKEEINESTSNTYILKMNNLDEETIEKRYSDLTKNPDVTSVMTTADSRKTYDGIVNNLSMVVLLITILSGGLAAIVIYNLTDININERIREIATLRVCGYRRREVLFYIIREILFMSIIGILIGLGIGAFLHWFIMVNIQSIGLMFSNTIKWSSYLITIAISFVFVIGVSMCFYPRIRKINMAESLKSVE